MTSYLEQYAERFYLYLYRELNPDNEAEIFKQINSFMTSVKETSSSGFDDKAKLIKYSIDIKISGKNQPHIISKRYREPSYSFFEAKSEAIFSFCASMLKELFVKAYG